MALRGFFANICPENQGEHITTIKEFLWMAEKHRTHHYLTDTITYDTFFSHSLCLTLLVHSHRFNSFFSRAWNFPNAIMNNPQASNGSSRQPSPTSFEVATELLRFVSQNSCEKRAATNLAPASLVTLPASIATSEIVAAAPFSGSMHSMVARAATSASASTVAQLLPIDCSTDGHLHVPRRTPCINRPIDHTYTDYAPISDDNLRRLDFDDSILNDSCLCPEKKRLMEMLREKISKNGGLAQAFPSKVCLKSAI
jgi:hypothetical protein